MLIFDRFPSRDHALRFAATCTERFSLAAEIHDSQDSSDVVDPFPYVLDPPVVLVDRPDSLVLDERLQVEASVEALVCEYGGCFAGT